MHAFAPSTLWHGATGKFIDDHDFAVLHDVLLIAVKKFSSEKRLDDQLKPPILSAPQTRKASRALHQLLHTGSGQIDFFVFSVWRVMDFDLERTGEDLRHRRGI